MLFGAEIQNSGLQRQFSPGKGPFAVLDPHLLSFEQQIVSDAARDLNARIDAAHAHSLARRRLQAQQVGEMDLSRKPSHRAKTRRKATTGREAGRERRWNVGKAQEVAAK